MGSGVRRPVSASHARRPKQRPNRGGREDDAPPVEPICGVPGYEGEEERRKELREPDVAQVQRSLRQGVDLPADGDVHHLQPEDGEQP
jgi:hypothetical protein